MSVTFRPVLGDGRPLLRCACELTVDGRAAFPRAGYGIDDTCPACACTLNVNERNGQDLLEYLGLPREPYGSIGAVQLAALIETRLAMVEVEAEIQPAESYGQRGCFVYTGGRAAGYLRERARALRVMCALAGPHRIGWS